MLRGYQFGAAPENAQASTPGRPRDPEQHEGAGREVDVVDDVVERRGELRYVLVVDRSDEHGRELLLDLVIP